MFDPLYQLVTNNKNIIMIMLIVAIFSVITYIYYRNYVIITTEECEYVKKNELITIKNELAKSKIDLNNVTSKLNQMITSSKYGEIVYNNNQLPFTYQSISKTPFYDIFDGIGMNNILINNEIRSTNQYNDDLNDDNNANKIEEIDDNIGRVNNNQINNNQINNNGIDNNQIGDNEISDNEISDNEIGDDEIDNEHIDHISVSSEDLLFGEKSNIKLSDKNIDLSNNNELNNSSHLINDNSIKNKKKKITLKKKNNNDIDNNE